MCFPYFKDQTLFSDKNVLPGHLTGHGANIENDVLRQVKLSN